jgi:hypothetical protein
MADAGSPAHAHPGADLEVGDPLEAELRVLDLLPGSWSDGRGAPPASHSRPLLRRTIFPPDSMPAPDRNAALSWRRLERALNRDRPGPRGTPRPGETPHLWRLDQDGDPARFDLSARIEGRVQADPDTTRLTNLSGLHLRGALGFDRWVLQSHWLIGQVDSASRFGDPIVTGEDYIATVEQALIAYSSQGDRWAARFGRGRWHWGPGNEASLLLSKTSAPLTALEVRGSLAGGRLQLTAMSATLQGSAGEQLAAHRIEWLAGDALRLGVAEAAVYSSSGWRPLYMVGLLPYTVAQRLESQDEPGAALLRNNVMVSLDAAWRIAPGTRVYGEFLVDDLHTRSNDNPDKLGFQLGWDGLGTALGSRLRWNGEYTRITPYVYTSFFGREAAAQGRPLGFPTGPDARRLRLWVACDPSADFELSATAARTEKGENDLGEPFLPGSVRARSIWTPLGVVERASAIEAQLRWWPAGGLDIALSAGYEWLENAGHSSGRNRDRGRVALEARIGR